MAYRSLSDSIFGINPEAISYTPYLNINPVSSNIGMNIGELPSFSAAPSTASRAAASVLPTSPTGRGLNFDWLGDVGEFFNKNGETIGNIASGVGGLFNAYNSMRGYGLAKDNFNLQKKAFETNLRNSTKTYNTALEDRIRGRSAEQSEADIQKYLGAHRL